MKPVQSWRTGIASSLSVPLRNLHSNRRYSFAASLASLFFHSPVCNLSSPRESIFGSNINAARNNPQGGHMYVVLGATGHTGSTVADKLLAKGEKVRAVGRDERRLERLRQRGAETFVADISDPNAAARAFAGADAAYL